MQISLPGARCEMSGGILMPVVRYLLTCVFIVSLPATSFLASAAIAGPSQEQPSSDAPSQSIADAARRSREAAKNASKPLKVITDDDLDKKNVKPGAQGLTVDAPAKLETQPPTSDAVAAAATLTSPSADPATTPAASDDPEILKMKEVVADAERDMDLLKRELALQQDTFLSNADHQHDPAGKVRLDSLQQQLNDKQQDVERLKTRLAALQELHPTPPPAKPAKQPTAPSAPATQVAPAGPSQP
jgi:hypothetical protein